MRFLLIFIFTLFAFQSTRAQYRQKSIVITADTIKIDTLSIVYNGFIVKRNNYILPLSWYKIDYTNATMLWLSDSLRFDTITVSYTVLPYNIGKSFYNKLPPSDNYAMATSKYPFAYSPSTSNDNALGIANLKRSGSISRGISVGNAQNLSVNSALNLQLSGKIADDIELNAVITDNNIPIQAEGNTRQLQEFDKIYLQLKHKNEQLTVGNFDLGSNSGRYLRFYKKNTGAYYSMSKVADSTLDVSVAAGLSRGKFVRNTLNTTEGNQGPYKLLGADNEQFIIILSGTEKVYIDGIALKRGENEDYTIDYNTAEIIFMPSRLITVNTRVVVEFQYSDKNYARFLTHTAAGYTDKDKYVKVNFYNENDSKNRPLGQSLDNVQKQFLSSIGNDINTAFYTSADTASYSTTEIRYLKKDTLGQSIFEYTTSNEVQLYSVRFTFIGQGKGDYMLKNAVANGNVYEWTAPINGIPQGSYAPVQLLITPKTKQMASIEAFTKLSESFSVLNETALSRADPNTYSAKDNALNQGIATYTALNYMGRNTSEKRSMHTVSYEFTDKYFEPIEPYRSPEFNRNFGLNNLVPRKYEHIITYNFNQRKVSNYDLNLSSQYLLKEKFYEGLLSKIIANKGTRHWLLSTTTSALNAKDLNNDIVFLRTLSSIKYLQKKVNYSLFTDIENNQTKLKTTHEIQLQSFGYYTYGIAAESHDSLENRGFLRANFRKDDKVIDSVFQHFSNAYTAETGYIFGKNYDNTFEANATYRTVKYTQANIPLEQVSIGRLLWNTRIFGGFISQSSNYELSAGQEPKRLLSYIEVPAGRGTHIWLDYNADGLKTLNEFQIAKFQYEANYIKFYTTSVERTKVTSAAVGVSVSVLPKELGIKESFAATVLNNIDYRTAIRIGKKTLPQPGIASFIPFSKQLIDSVLITADKSVGHYLNINLIDGTLRTELSVLNQNNRFLQSNGIENRSNAMQSIGAFYNISNDFSLNIIGKTFLRNYTTALASAAGYNISGQDINPELRWTISNATSVALVAQYGTQQNAQVLGGQKVEAKAGGIELRTAKSIKTTFTTKINVIENKFFGESNTNAGYELLGGLQPGRNFTWGLSIQQLLGKSLQLVFQYDARKSENVRTLQTGQIQARAFF